MNTKVNFNIAILLKEVGYNIIYYDSSFYNENYPDSTPFNYYITQENYLSNTKQFAYYYVAPTIAQAVMWIYEKYGIWIYVKRGYGWEFVIEKADNSNIILYNDGTFNSPSEAYLAAIENVLKNFGKNLEFTK